MKKETVDALHQMGKVFDVIVVDLNSIAHASLYQPGLVKLSTFSETYQEKMLTGSIMGTVNTIGTLISAFPKALVIGLWDGHAKWRYDILSTYKDGRRADPHSADPKVRDKAEIQRQYKMQAPYLRMMLNSLGVTQVRVANAEADDVCGLLVDSLKANHETLLVTSDTDWLQKLSPTTSWFRATTPENLITWEQTQVDGVGLIVDKVSFDSPESYLACKALAGDSSDAIFGVDGIGLATAYKYLKAFGSFEHMWAEFDAGRYTPKGVKASSVCTKDARDLYKRNFELMSFAFSRFDQFEENCAITRTPCDRAEFDEICQTFEFTRLGTQFEKFQRNFDATAGLWQSVVWSCLNPPERPTVEADAIEQTDDPEKSFAGS